MATKKCAKNAVIFYCELCDFKCSKESNYTMHLSTLKHQMATSATEKMPKNAADCLCNVCGKSYKDRTGLWRHKKKCVPQDKTQESSKSAISLECLLQENMEIKKDNLDMKKMMMEMIGKMGNTISNNTTNNNQQNNHFNINVFLNETCKDAMNFSDFIERIEVSHDDLENNAQLGFVNGITKILMDNLKLLSIQERPIHCTDVKRDTLYIKDQDVWNKDNSSEILENAITEVSRKSIHSLSQWKKANPDYSDMDSEFSKKCIPMQQNSMGICNKETVYPKIIHKLAKENAVRYSRDAVVSIMST